MIISDFPKIKEAAMIIALDNGMINRFCSEEQFLARAEGAIFADGVPLKDVQLLESFLQTLSPDQMETICAGEHSDMLAVEEDAPFSTVEPTEKVTRLLNDIFES